MMRERRSRLLLVMLAEVGVAAAFPGEPVTASDLVLASIVLVTTLTMTRLPITLSMPGGRTRRVLLTVTLGLLPLMSASFFAAARHVLTR